MRSCRRRGRSASTRAGSRCRRSADSKLRCRRVPTGATNMPPRSQRAVRSCCRRTSRSSRRPGTRRSSRSGRTATRLSWSRRSRTQASSCASCRGATSSEPRAAGGRARRTTAQPRVVESVKASNAGSTPITPATAARTCSRSSSTASTHVLPLRPSARSWSLCSFIASTVVRATGPFVPAFRYAKRSRTGNCRRASSNVIRRGVLPARGRRAAGRRCAGAPPATAGDAPPPTRERAPGRSSRAAAPRSPAALPPAG